MKRVFVVHGWGGHPNEVWFPWIKDELENKGFQVSLLQMPDTDNPKINKWVPYLEKSVGKTDKETYFIGHSIGCQTIIRYIESLPLNIKVGGAVFVAGFFHLTGIENPDEIQMVWPWINNPIDFDKVKARTKKSIAIFSDNDEFVPLTNISQFQQYIGAKTIVEHDMDHFNGKRNPKYKQAPIILKSILEMAE